MSDENEANSAHDGSQFEEESDDDGDGDAIAETRRPGNSNEEDTEHYDFYDLKFMMNVPFLISVELGRVTLKIREMLRLQMGSVIEIDKLAGEPMEILINGRHTCRGEVIVINEKYGVRLTDIIKPSGSTEDGRGAMSYKSTYE